MDGMKIALAVFLLALACPAMADEEAKGVAQDIFFDKEAKAVSYNLNHPAYIRVRLGVEEGPLYQTLVNWEERGKGAHRESYSGLDMDNAVFTFNYFTEDDADKYGLKMEELLPHPAQLAIGKTLPAARLNQLHKAHKRQGCYDPKVSLYLKGAKVKEGIPVVRKNTPLIIEIDKKDQTWFTKERFQLHIFLDDVLVHAELDGYTPYIWNFSPEGLNKGRHVLAVNLSGFADHIGAAILPILVEKS
jgi:hypothetical protein